LFAALEDLNLTTKKKKKKKIRLDDDALKALSQEQPRPLEPPAIPTSQSATPIISQETSIQWDYALPIKKRKRRPNVTFEGFDDVLAEEGIDVVKDDVIEEDGDMEIIDSSAWAGSDRDYTYDELLERVFNIMRQKNPSMVDRKTKLVMKPPQVMRVGARRTSFANFTEICKLLRRQPKHLLAFLLAELGTNGSIDGNNQLIIKGRFQQKQIETVLRRYIKEYVTCHTCRSPDTMLQRENRLFFLQCGTCGSRCTVENVKSGFQAVTNRRARQQQQ
jgi:translation initiation factor 2 subunit 2